MCVCMRVLKCKLLNITKGIKEIYSFMRSTYFLFSNEIYNLDLKKKLK